MFFFFYPFRSLAHLAHFNVPDTASFGYTGTVCDETFLSCNLTLFLTIQLYLVVFYILLYDSFGSVLTLQCQ